MPPGRYAVTDAGSLLLGDLSNTLGAFLQEKRARDERMNYRAEQKRRYDERILMEKQRLAQQQAQEVFGAQATMAAMPATQALELAPAAARAFPAMGGDAGKAAGAQYAPSQMGARVQGLAEGLSGMPPGLGEGPLPFPHEMGQMAMPGAPAAPPTTRYPGTAALVSRAGREAAQEARKKESGAATDFAKMLGKIAPMEAAKILGMHLGQPGETTAELDVPGHLLAAEAEAKEARDAKEREAAARGGRRGPRQEKTLPKHLLDRLVRDRNKADFIAEAEKGTILTTLRGNPVKAEATYNSFVEDNIDESMRTSRKAIRSDRVRSLRTTLQEARKGKAVARRIPDWQGGKAAVEAAEAAESEAQRNLDDEVAKFFTESALSPTDRALEDARNRLKE